MKCILTIKTILLLLLFLIVLSTPIFHSKVGAQDTSCSFRPVAYVLEKKADGKLYPLRSPSVANWGILYDKIKKAYGGTPLNWSAFDAIGEFDPCGVEGCQVTGDTWGFRDAPEAQYNIKQPGGDVADVSLSFDRTAFRIIQQCQPYQKCLPISDLSQANSIKGISIACDREYRFGWVVERAEDINQECSLNNDSCKPQSLTGEFRNDKRIRVGWQNPSSCPAAQVGQTQVLIDIYNSKNQRICSKNQILDNSDTSTDCVLGRDKARPNNEEVAKFSDDESYIISTSLANQSCSSATSSITIVYHAAPMATIEPTQEPTSPPPRPTSDQICNSAGQPCSETYVETCADGSVITCHKVGTCSEAGDGSKCSWGGGSKCDPDNCQPITTPSPTRTPPPPPSAPYCSIAFLKPYFLKRGLSESQAQERATIASCFCQRESGGNPLVTTEDSGLSCLTAQSFGYAIGLFQISVFPWANRCPGGTYTVTNSCPSVCTKQNCGRSFSGGNGLTDRSTYAPFPTCQNDQIFIPFCIKNDQSQLDTCVGHYQDVDTNINTMLDLSKNGTDWTDWEPTAQCVK